MIGVSDYQNSCKTMMMSGRLFLASTLVKLMLSLVIHLTSLK